MKGELEVFLAESRTRLHPSITIMGRRRSKSEDLVERIACRAYNTPFYPAIDEDQGTR